MRCIVPGCSNTNTSTRFHSFPLSNGALCRSWLQSIRHPTFLSDTDVKVIRQERLMVCSDHFVVADYNGRCLKDGAVPSVFPWTAIRVKMLSLPFEEKCEKDDTPLTVCSQTDKGPNQQAVNITQTSQGHSILKSSEVLVSVQCLLELFKCCSVCLVECCFTVEGHERLFSVTQDCQSCGHHRVWRSHPNRTEQPVETLPEDDKCRENLCKEDKECGETFHHSQEVEDATSHPEVEHTLEPEDDNSKESMVVVPHRMKSKEVSMETKHTIVNLRSQKKSIREIAKALGLSKSTVAYIIKKKASTGDVSNKKRCGRPKKTTAEDDQIILSIMTKNPRTPVQQIRNTLREVGREVSVATIRRKLHSLNHTIETAFLHNLKATK
ncbi:hypothetical protein P4O66_008672 [Electrophorus voltai]|uniref:THAP domain-containing protein 1 n=1 Tax=Electrophorus voltai TaxID=2609070 RepID=A0AAD8ZD05_9TELE|nr:hypothetical protein P4O66_008672 [Electrophorus voltai]